MTVHPDYARLCDPQTPAGELRKLWQAHPMEDDYARALARHPNCPRNMYSHFLRYFPEELKQNPSFALWAMEKPEEVRPQYMDIGAMEKRFRAGEGTHYMFAVHLQDKDAYYRRLAVEFAPAEMLDASIDDTDDSVRRVLAKREDLPLHFYERLAKDVTPGVRGMIAKNPSAPALVRAMLAQDGDGKVRAKLVGNAEFALQGDPAKDKSAAVRRTLAGQTEDATVLIGLARDAVADVRARAAKNPALPAAVMQELLADTNQDVRAGLARNPALHADIAARLAADNDFVRLALAKNDALPPQLQRPLYESGDKKIKQEVLSRTRDAAFVKELLDSSEFFLNAKKEIGPILGLAYNEHFAGSNEMTQILFKQPERLVRWLAGGRAEHLSLEQNAQLVREGCQKPLSRAVPELLPDLVAITIEINMPDLASWALFHPAIEKVNEAHAVLRDEVLKKIIAGFPKTSVAAKARKMLAGKK